MNKSIVIDARSLSSKPAGVARYVTEISKELSSLGWYITFISNKEIVLPKDLLRKNVKVKILKTPKFIPGTIVILFLLKLFFLKSKPIFWGANHVVPIWGFKSILTLHDIVAIKYKDTMTIRNWLMNIISLKISLLACNKLSTVSHFTRLEVVENLWAGNEKKPITVIRNSVDQNLFKIAVITEKSNLLSVGTLEPRKNLIVLIKAFSRLIKEYGYSGKLIIIGSEGWKNKHLRDLITLHKLQNSIILPGYVSDLELVQYYNSCELFVFPSKYEGFGIPPLEAYCCGAKIVCSTQSEIPYLDLDGVFLYNPQENDLYQSIIEALGSSTSNSEYDATWVDSAINLDALICELENE